MSPAVLYRPSSSCLEPPCGAERLELRVQHPVLVTLMAPGQARAAWVSPGSHWPLAGLCFHRERVTSSKLLCLIPGNLLPGRSALCSAAAEKRWVPYSFLTALGKAKHKTPTAWEQCPSWGCRVRQQPWGCARLPMARVWQWGALEEQSFSPGTLWLQGSSQCHLGLAASPLQLCMALAVLCGLLALPGVERTYPEPSPIAGGCVCVCGRGRGAADPQCHRRDCSGSALPKLELLRSRFCFCMSYFSRLPLPLFSCPFPSASPFSSPILPLLFFCFFSFCSSCLAQAAARGDGVVGSSGRWAACRGAFGSSPGSRQARGVRPGTCNTRRGQGRARGGAEPNLCLVSAGPARGAATRAQGLASAAAWAALSPRLALLPRAPLCCRWDSEGG